MLRPPLPPCPPTELEFQLLDVVVHNKACPTFDLSDPRLLLSDPLYATHATSKAHLFDKRGPGVVYLFGVTAEGHSVCCKVPDFQPWFFVELTPQVTLLDINAFLAKIGRSHGLRGRLEVVQRKRVYGWVPSSTEDVHTVRTFSFAQLFFPTVAAMNAAAQIAKQDHPLFDISELKVQPSEKFLAQRSLTASGWVRTRMEMSPLSERCSKAQMEGSCNMAALHPCDMDRVAPVVVAAVDIEVQSHDCHSFPSASHPADAVTFIGTTFWVYGDTAPRLKVMQVLGSAEPVSGIQVESYHTELELLEAWRDLIALHADPDNVVSYNGTGFDFAYLSARHELLRKDVRRYSRFTHLGRLLFEPGPLKARELSSAAMGQNEIASFPMTGRWQMDLFQYIKTNYKLSSYKLDDVTAHFLKDHAAAGGKVTLDYNGWVRELTAAAVAALRDYMTTRLSLCDESVNAVEVELQKAVRCSMAPLQVEGQRDEIERTLDEGDELAEDEAGRWMHVHRALHHSLSLLYKCLDTGGGRRQELRDEVAGWVEAHIQAALDASGSDNYKKLFRLYTHSAGARSTIVQYCQVDCDLVLYLMDRLSVLPNTVQMSQVTNTLLTDIANRGQQIKTFNLIARYAYNRGYVMNFRDVGWDPAAEYEGATVLPPTPGYYQRPVATLDFASLYPSIMQAYNLCFSSIVLDQEYLALEASGAQYGRYEIAGKTWVFQEHVKGLLPDILKDLVAARRKSKKDMAKCEKGSLDYKLADGKQLALKISCNSVYGFTGALTAGMFPCMPVAVATTFNGRHLIQQTKAFVEREYGATVIYGDTDSVMLQFPGVETVHQAFELAERVAQECSATFRDVVQLEFEKVYMPYLLIKKKHYAGIKYEGSPDDPPSLDAKGLALVRRDNCKLVRDTMREVLLQAMRNNNPMAAYEAVRRQVQRLVNREVGLEELQISNFLRKDLKSDNHPHVQVVKNMVARGSFGVPRVGDRVPYCVVEGKSDKLYERAEHPDYIVQAGLKVDLNYYLRNQLQQRLEKVLQPLPVPDEKRLFDEAAREIQRKRQGIARLDSFGFMFASQPMTAPATSTGVVTKKVGSKSSTSAAPQSLAKFALAAGAVVDKGAKGRKRGAGGELKQQSLVAMFAPRA